MRTGEVGILAALAVFIAGGIFVAFAESPAPVFIEGASEPEIELSVYDMLKQSIQPYHFGNVPRESFRGDTTLWVVDLDHNMYSVPQTALHITRILRDLQFTEITASERLSGGIVFNALFPNGQPLEMSFTCP